MEAAPGGGLDDKQQMRLRRRGTDGLSTRRWRTAGIVNLSGRGMFVVSVARQLG